jgi:hypothetical protein
MKKQRIDEIINYYSISVQILEEVLKQDAVTIDEDNRTKATISHSLFKDTVVCLNELLELKTFDTE